MISKSGMDVMRTLCSGSLSIGALAQKLQRSVPWTSEAVTALEREGFVERVKHGVTTVVQPLPTQHARALQSLFTEVPGIPYEKYLFGRRIFVLWTLLYEAKSVQEIAWTLNIGEEVVRRHLRFLGKWAVLWHEKGRYQVAKRGNPLLWAFLDAYRNYTPIPGLVVWKLGDEILFKTLEEWDAVPGGFMGYHGYGINYGGSIHYTWFLPKRKLSVEEVLVQSLVELDDPRDLDVCVTFMFKHRLTYKQLVKLAVKYDCRERLKDLLTVMWAPGSRIVTEHLPPTSRREIDEIMDVYKVKRYVQKSAA